MKLNKIYNQDCMATMHHMPYNFIDLTVTSPPYDNLRTYNDNIDETWGEEIWKPIIKELYKVTKEGGVVVWVVGDATINGSETGTSFRQALHAIDCGFRLHDTMIYNSKKAPLTHNRYEQEFEYMFVFSKGKPKTFNPIMENKSYLDTRKNKSFRKERDGTIDYGYCKGTDKRMRYNIWKYFTGKGKDDCVAFNHPAVFPESLARDHIYSWSNEGDIVYDPFCGSGTTPKMAHLLKRKWIGSEISKEYVDLAYKRLEPYLTQTTLL